MTASDPPPGLGTEPEPLLRPGGSLERTRATVAAGPLLAPVLARLVGIHASRAGLTIDRLDDAVMITDALSAHAQSVTPDGRIPVSLQTEPGRLELRIGPLAPGAGQRVLAATRLPEAGSLVEVLADEVRVRTGAGGGEMLILRLSRRDHGVG